ncbi:hypothetical protein GPJ56_005398 [Histomonas meleagridis]|uniref:uncharacterized protein n=1 Tax=Histomonas meleagridis TaxID=135588 RepID=UPI00355A42E1|nr:hypothetical protein GPJ56_005398 [Histomonas meleagridis]KAH0801832.1 hypothetical protein GO595_005399 [Histomonas meleagridis]
MLAIFLSFSSSKYYVAPTDGMCPNHEACNEYCLRVSSRNYECLSLTTINLCYDFRSYYFIIWACFVVPVLLCFVCSLICCNKVRSPLISVFINLLLGTYWSICIMGIYCAVNSNEGPDFIPIIILPIFLAIIVSCLSNVCGLCSNCGSSRNPKFIYQIMTERCLEKDEFENYINTILRSPPVIHLKGGVHIYQRTGKHTTIFTIPFQQAAPYVSWEERSPPVHIPHDKYILVKTKIKFKYTKDLKAYIQELKKQMTAKEIEKGALANNITLITEPYVEGMKPFLLATSGGKVPTFHKFTRSCFGKFLWYFTAFIGLNTVYESIYCIGIKRLKMKSVKYISSTPCYHCPAYEYDGDLNAVE